MNFDVANLLFLRLYQSSNLVHKNGTRFVGEFGATTQQWAVLGALMRPAVRQRGISVKVLMEHLLLSRQNVTAVLDRLEARNWLERVRTPEDGRTRLVRIAPSGEAIWQAMQGAITAFYTGAMQDFSQDEQVQLFHLLDKLKTNLQAMNGPDCAEV